MALKRILFYLECILLISCKSTVEPILLPRGEIPYQRFVVDEDTEVLLYIYDRWGDENNIYVIHNDSIYCSHFEVDPIPIVKFVRNDTVFLEYHNFFRDWGKVVDVDCGPSIYDWARKVGPYTIINCNHYDLYASGVIYRDKVDSIHVNGLELTLYNNGNAILNICANDIICEKNADGCYYICYSELDTISNQKMRSLPKYRSELLMETSYAYPIDKETLFRYMLPKH